jgi:lipase chaperone LimK
VKLAIAALTLALLAAGAVVFLAHQDDPRSAAAPQPTSRAPAFVPSLAGTRTDGAATVVQEQLVVDQELGYLFDYYLAGLGERDLAIIKAEIERELSQRLPPAAAAQARRLLDNYLRYKEALAKVEQGLQAGTELVANLRARRDAMLKLRHDYFSDTEIAGLFGLSDLRDADALARLEITNDKTLDDATRRARIDELDRAMPPALREERAAPTALIRLDQSVQALRAGGAADDTVYRLRASALSPEAAARLADVDREEAAWQARIAAWRQERQQAAPASAQQLRDKYFNAQEQKRLAAYE